MARPLTKKKENGSLYVRPPDIEAAIDQAVSEDLSTIVRRSVLCQRNTPGFVPLECLVFLIRDARRRGEEGAMNALMPRLLARCEAILKNKIPQDCVPSTEDLRAELLGEFSVLFAEDDDSDTNQLDFFECRFSSAFFTFRLPFIKRERKRIAPLIYTSGAEEPSDGQVDEEFHATMSKACRQPPSQIDDVFRGSLLRAINALPPDECKAVTLRYIYGFSEESTDPAEITAASLCGVTGRTIRNRLQRGIATLSKQFTKEGKGSTAHESQ
ncbi:MAG: sigma factor-like helix-turn-helix DNA-binding protein [Bryobacteraceae bacterium]